MARPNEGFIFLISFDFAEERDMVIYGLSYRAAELK